MSTSKCSSKDFYVNITTNGYFIDKIINNKNIRQINISLHSGVGNIDNYIKKIFSFSDILKKNTYVNYRLWLGSNKKIIEKLEEKYNVKIDKSRKLEENVFVDIDEEFEWPDVNNNIYKTSGKCYGIRDHVGILVDGSVVPCCLDGNGSIKLGNIFESSLDSILNSKRALKMVEGFKNKKLEEELCKHCGFIEKINKN